MVWHKFGPEQFAGRGHHDRSGSQFRSRALIPEVLDAVPGFGRRSANLPAFVGLGPVGSRIVARHCPCGDFRRRRPIGPFEPLWVTVSDLFWPATEKIGPSDFRRGAVPHPANHANPVARECAPHAQACEGALAISDASLPAVGCAASAVRSRVLSRKSLIS